jgi:phosphoserine/homoserine phosphotransferase
MKILVADLEGVFLPEIWINVALKTGIEELKLTTRDISEVISTLEPLAGAREILDWIRSQTQIIILSDTFEEFAKPLMAKLGFPALLCHNLTIDAAGNIIDYNLRIDNQKARAVKALKALNYHVIAFGDSYNDIGMIQAADQGFFFCPPLSCETDFPDIPVTRNYDELKTMIKAALDK